MFKIAWRNMIGRANSTTYGMAAYHLNTMN